MKIRGFVIGLCTVLLFLCALPACASRQQEDPQLSLETILTLSEKGDALSWQDFAAYSGRDIGSGLYILRYEVNEDYDLLIGGGSMDIKPMYIRLVKADHPEEAIDIRTEDVARFVGQ